MTETRNPADSESEASTATHRAANCEADHEVQDRVNREHRLFEPKPEEGVHAGELMVIPTQTRLTKPIIEMNDSEQGLLFAELSNAAYLDEPSCRATVEPIGFSEVLFFDRDGAQAYRLENDTDIVRNVGSIARRFFIRVGGRLVVEWNHAIMLNQGR